MEAQSPLMMLLSASFSMTSSSGRRRQLHQVPQHVDLPVCSRFHRHGPPSTIDVGQTAPGFEETVDDLAVTDSDGVEEGRSAVAVAGLRHVEAELGSVDDKVADEVRATAADRFEEDGGTVDGSTDRVTSFQKELERIHVVDY